MQVRDNYKLNYLNNNFFRLKRTVANAAKHGNGLVHDSRSFTHRDCSCVDEWSSDNEYRGKQDSSDDEPFDDDDDDE